MGRSREENLSWRKQRGKQRLSLGSFFCGRILERSKRVSWLALPGYDIAVRADEDGSSNRGRGGPSPVHVRCPSFTILEEELCRKNEESKPE